MKRIEIRILDEKGQPYARFEGDLPAGSGTFCEFNGIKISFGREAARPAPEVPQPAPEAPRPVVEAPRPVVEAPRPVVEAPQPVVEAPRPAPEPIRVEPILKVIKETPHLAPRAPGAKLGREDIVDAIESRFAKAFVHRALD